MVLGRSILVFVAASNLLSYCLVLIDKERAVRGRTDMRVPEKIFFILALLGGWPLGILSCVHWRHKTQKISFQLKYAASTALSIFLTYKAARLMLTRSRSQSQ